MTINIELVRVVENLISLKKEGTHWDFKLQHQASIGKLIHDVLCLANAKHNGRRYLIYGVDDVDFSLRSIDNDPNRRTQAELAGLFRDNISKFFQSNVPKFLLEEIVIAGATIDVLIIDDCAEKPFYLTKNIVGVRAHHIYTRLLDTNTPINDTAPPHEIERMWRQRFGLESPPLKRAERYLLDSHNWIYMEQSVGTAYYYNPHPEFTIQEVISEESCVFDQEWTRGEIRQDNNRTGSYEIRYLQTIIARISYVSFDDGKKFSIAPFWKPAKSGRFYYYCRDSIEYACHKFICYLQKGDDSLGLRIQGNSTGAQQARERWKSGVSIPVLSEEELGRFFEDKGYATGTVLEPSTDSEEQYELFLLVLLEFEEWRCTYQWQ